MTSNQKLEIVTQTLLNPNKILKDLLIEQCEQTLYLLNSLEKKKNETRN